MQLDTCINPSDSLEQRGDLLGHLNNLQVPHAALLVLSHFLFQLEELV